MAAKASHVPFNKDGPKPGLAPAPSNNYLAPWEGWCKRTQYRVERNPVSGSVFISKTNYQDRLLCMPYSRQNGDAIPIDNRAMSIVKKMKRPVGDEPDDLAAFKNRFAPPTDYDVGNDKQAPVKVFPLLWSSQRMIKDFLREYAKQHPVRQVSSVSGKKASAPQETPAPDKPRRQQKVTVRTAARAATVTPGQPTSAPSSAKKGMVHAGQQRLPTTPPVFRSPQPPQHCHRAAGQAYLRSQNAQGFTPPPQIGSFGTMASTPYGQPGSTVQTMAAANRQQVTNPYQYNLDPYSMGAQVNQANFRPPPGQWNSYAQGSNMWSTSGSSSVGNSGSFSAYNNNSNASNSNWNWNGPWPQ